MNETISVIVPVYNVENYLRQSLDSILSQDYMDLEILLIDDGSEDSSGRICDEYAANDARIHLIHQKNGGAAAAKNTGLNNATGKYLAFADSDDYVEPGAYSYMIGLLKDTGAQTIQCAFRDIYCQYSNDRIIKPGRKEWDVKEYMSQYLKDWTCSLLWDKLFLIDLFSEIRFPEGNKIDDEFFTYKGIMNADKIVTDDRIVYNYRKRRSGVMLSPESRAQIVRDRITSLCERRKLVPEQFPSLQREYDLHFLEAMMILSREPGLTEDSLVRIKKELKNYLKEPRHTHVPKNLLIPLLSLLKKKWQEPVKKTDEENDDIYFD